MAYLGKEHVEIQKTIMELPKTAIIMVSFFATATALVLRSSLGDGKDSSVLTHFLQVMFPGQDPAISDYIHFAAKVIYVGAVAFSVWFVYECYHFMTSIVSNITKEITEVDGSGAPDQDAALKRQLELLLGKKYSSLKSAINTGVLLWSILLGIFVFAL